jgi:hypothetical protein
MKHSVLQFIFASRREDQGELAMMLKTKGGEQYRPSFHMKNILLAGAGLILISGPAAAHPQQFHTTFTALNKDAPLDKVGLNPSASAQVTYNHDNDSLHVVIMGTGFEPGIPHVAHIHGNLVNPMTTGSGALDSKTPTSAQDVDHDGFIELFEGLTTYGPILFDFENIDSNMDGTIDYDQTFDLRDPNAPFGFINPLDPSQGRYGITDLVGLSFDQLALREMVIHGLVVPQGVGIDNPNQNPPTDDEVNGHSTFAPGPGPGGEFGHTIVFPVASGELLAGVPEPATWALMLAGFGLAGVAIRTRRRPVVNA